MITNATLTQRDRSVLWHPCTQMQDHEWLPLIPIRRGEGVWLEDYEGRRYIDAISSWWVNLFGHANPRIAAAIAEQANTLEHVLLAGFSHEPAIELAERLVALAPPGLSRCFYAESGSAAVEIALKMSFHFWRNNARRAKTKFICLDNSYHGETLGALAVSNVALYKDVYGPLLLQPLVAPTPDCFHRSAGESWTDYSRRMFEPMAQLIGAHAHEVCAVIIEPLVQCAGGMRMYHPVYLKLLRECCDRHQIHLIADEIAVGFGRTGTLFACEQAGISPDFLCLGKGLTGGFLPLSAVLTTENVYAAFYDHYATLKAFLHSHSFTGNPLACRAALATLDIFENEPVIERNHALAQRMQQATQHLIDHPNVAEVRQTGMTLAIEMVADKATRAPFPWQERRGLHVYRYALEHGALLRPLGNVVYFMPPFVISDDEIDLLADIATAGIDKAVRA
jgi:adenosylmethionine-8-amino-7-oxononanoate aminotransferase